MQVQVTRILQIGDVHYPDWPTERQRPDHGTVVHTADMIDQLSYFRIERVLKRLVGVIATEKPSVICLVGDITTKGKQSSLDQAAAHFSALLRQPYGSHYTPKIVLVPGNHDIGKADATDSGLVGKFAAMNRIFQSHGLPAIPVDLPTKIDLMLDDAVLARIYGINTCLGSWELSSFGPSVLNAIEKIQKRLDKEALGSSRSRKSASKRAANFDDLHYDNYDAPFVHQSTLSVLSTDIPGLAPDALAVVVGHHNMLSQEVTRYAPFADLINGGALRRALQRSKRPVVYLHGHIHADPVETIQDVEHPESQVVAISAPQLVDGFNLIEIYSAVGRRPLGVSLRKFRIEPNGTVSERPTMRTPFHVSSRRRRLSARSHRLLTYIESERVIEFSNLVDQPEVAAMGYSEAAAESEVLLLYWLNMIEVEHLSYGPSRWVLSAEQR